MLPLPNRASVCLVSFSTNQKKWLLEGDGGSYGRVKVRVRGEFLESLERVFEREWKNESERCVFLGVGGVFAFWVFRELTKGLWVCVLFLG